MNKLESIIERLRPLEDSFAAKIVEAYDGYNSYYIAKFDSMEDRDQLASFLYAHKFPFYLNVVKKEFVIPLIENFF